ncbi:MAG: hypothetical protein OHM56_07395 [Spiroplasma phoeniceum]|nr:MAG: hypothetical protein OHM57_06795 [Spiroplasma phoeniceum]UZQ31463.1 MAG: hypothetical protein OHM56_07395 [Spiroplasma phoeniceum]
MFLINKHNNKRLTPKRLSNLYSALRYNETYHYIGVYDKNNNYDASFETDYEPEPIYNGTQNLKILLQ